MVQRELGDRCPTHRVAHQGKIPQAQRLRCSEEVPRERLHCVIRFCSGTLRVASASVAEGQRAETGRVQGLLDETPDTARRPVAVDQYELLWPCAMLKVLQLYGICLHKVCAHIVLPASVEIYQAEGAPGLMLREPDLLRDWTVVGPRRTVGR